MMLNLQEKKIRWIARFAALALTLLPLSGCGSSASAANQDCLLGTWISEREVINKLGVQTVAARLTISEVQGHLLRGTSAWGLLEGDGGFWLDEFVEQDVEDVFGAYSPHSREFYLAETAETGVYHGRVVNQDEIDVFLVQSGEFAVVGFSRMKREGSRPTSCG